MDKIQEPKKELIFIVKKASTLDDVRDHLSSNFNKNDSFIKNFNPRKLFEVPKEKINGISIPEDDLINRVYLLETDVESKTSIEALESNVFIESVDFNYDYELISSEEVKDDSLDKSDFVDPHEFMNFPDTRFTSTFENVNIALLDSGVNFLRGLKNNLYQGPIPNHYGYDVVCHKSKLAGGLEPTTDFEGILLFNDCASPTENGNPHGTKVASIIAYQPSDDSPETSFYGMSDRATLINLKTMGRLHDTSTKANSEKLIFALSLAKLMGAKVINCSFTTGLTRLDTNLENIIKDLNENGIISVWAAGNEDEDVKDTFPQNQEYVITVGGITKDNRRFISNRRSFNESSNFGERVDVYALGADVPNVAYENETSAIEIKHSDGTSYAAPFVSTAIALAISKLQSNEKKYTFDFIKSTLLESATRIEDIEGNLSKKLDVSQFLMALDNLDV